MDIIQKYENCFLGFTNIINRNPDLKELVKQIPLSNIIFETDAPFFKDGHPYSLPQDILKVAKTVSEVKNIPILDACNINLNNCKKMYPNAFCY